MNHYVGIDLGTTNSSICSYDGHVVHIWKSPRQTDVTPSAIYIDKRGNRYFGDIAYTKAFQMPEDTATLFKRFMGTNTTINFVSAKLSMTPEECSAEIIKVLFGYLTEEIRNETETATVITVPAAFNQMKKDATMQAANFAGLSRIALMQEPVAAVMSVMRHSKDEGIFLVYDLGGGTFDISIAENIGGRVSLLIHNGIEMCGGRDIDRLIFNRVVVPWLRSNFQLPKDFIASKNYMKLRATAQWASERAKIELSSGSDTIISLNESDANCIDLLGKEMYIQIPINRAQLDELIRETVEQTIETTRETIKQAGLTANDIEKIVFVGGPTNYKPLRDKVSYELAISPNIDVNPMTAVAEGASIFAESIDWFSSNHNRKTTNREINTALDVVLRYTARTTDATAKIVLLTSGGDGSSVQVTSLDTGWTSGRALLKEDLLIEIPLALEGENRFSVVVYDQYGREVEISDSRIVITKTLASIDAIPASHAVGVEVIEKLGGKPVLDYLVREGDALPKVGKKTFMAGETLKAGSSSSINIKLWEGNITDPISDNRFIGVLKIKGTDFSEGVISTGADIECEYEMADSGAINLDVSIPCIGATFSNRNFYSRKEGQIDLDDIERIKNDGASLVERIEGIEQRIDDDRLTGALKKARNAASIDELSHEPEDIQRAANEVLESKRLFDRVRKEHLKEIRQMELNVLVGLYHDFIQRQANPVENETTANLLKTLQRSIDRNDNDFENQLDELKSKLFIILWRQDWFVIDRFYHGIADPYEYTDKVRFEILKQKGLAYIKDDKIDELRNTVFELDKIRIHDANADNMFDLTNIIKG